MRRAGAFLPVPRALPPVVDPVCVRRDSEQGPLAEYSQRVGMDTEP
jgi:hypothetical protein